MVADRRRGTRRGSRDVEGEGQVGLAHDLVPRAADVERMIFSGTLGRPWIFDGQVHERRRAELGKTAERRRHAGIVPEGLHHDHREARRPRSRRAASSMARRSYMGGDAVEVPDVGHRHRARKRHLLQARVETQVDGSWPAPCGRGARLGS